MKKFLSVVLASMMLMTAASALADNTEVANEDGTTTVTTEKGATFTYDKNDFETTVDENGNIEVKYTQETPADVRFTVEFVADTTAESYMAEAAGDAEVTKTTAFDEDESVEWMTFEKEEAGETYTTTTTVYARDYEGGCYVVTVYSYYTNSDAETAESTEETSDEEGETSELASLEQILGSLSFAK